MRYSRPFKLKKKKECGNGKYPFKSINLVIFSTKISLIARSVYAYGSILDSTEILKRLEDVLFLLMTSTELALIAVISGYTIHSPY